MAKKSGWKEIKSLTLKGQDLKDFTAIIDYVVQTELDNFIEALQDRGDDDGDFTIESVVRDKDDELYAHVYARACRLLYDATKCKPCAISENLKNIFEVEIRNEDLGGVSPSTLESALDSVLQAPYNIVAEWAKAKDTKDQLIRRNAIAEIRRLIKKYGGVKELKELID